MRSAEVAEATIRAALVRSLTRSNNAPKSSPGQELSLVDQMMLETETRDATFRVAVGLCEEDAVKRRHVAELMLTYVIGFPPSDAVVDRIISMCDKWQQPELSTCPFGALRRACETLRAMPRLSAASAGTHGGMFGGNGPAETAAVYRTVPDGSRPMPHYLQQPSMQPIVRDQNRRTVVFSNPSTKECAAVADEKNATVLEKHHVRHAFQVARCKDYIDQTPLTCSEELLQQQLKILGTYFDNYRSSVFVSRATAFVVKMWCDAYVSKLPLVSREALCAPPEGVVPVSPFLRMVTVSFAPILVQMMSAEYHCVRAHVYDIILTLAMHLQLVDTQKILPGLNHALEIEVQWLVLTIVRRQAFLEATDERMLMAALKCLLVVVPSYSLHSLDFGALKSFLQLQGLFQSYPHVALVLTETLAIKLLQPPEMKFERLCDVNASAAVPCEGLDEGWVATECGWTIDELLDLYMMSTTASSKLHIFHILFGIAARRVCQRGERSVSQQTSLRAAKVLADWNVPWYLQALTLYLSHRTARELPSQLSVDLGMKESREVKAFAVAALQMLVQMIERYHVLPTPVRRVLAAVTSSGGSGGGGQSTSDDPAINAGLRDTLKTFNDDCISNIPAMLKDDSAPPRQRRVGTMLLFQSLRILKQLGDRDANNHSVFATEQITLLLRAVASSATASVRSAMPEVLGALWYLARTQSSQALTALHIGLRSYLQTETNVAPLLRLFSYLVEGLTMDSATTSPSAQDGDICSLLMHGHRVALQSPTEILGPSTLWALYWSLRRSTLAVACRARWTLLTLLNTLTDAPLSSAGHHMALWSKVMSDAYPPAALIGAQKVIRISGIAAYDKYEAAISEAQRAANTSKLSNAYVMAVTIWERIEADNKA